MFKKNNTLEANNSDQFFGLADYDYHFSTSSSIPKSLAVIFAPLVCVISFKLI